nr:immunoglobulin heavy chain junction region [Mus musculus]MBK4196870.1 immunoglobulin heavy chain junction region [Mus musculus]
CARRMDYW